jgi:hypothetical protein
MATSDFIAQPEATHDRLPHMLECLLYGALFSWILGLAGGPYTRYLRCPPGEKVKEIWVG